VIIGHGRSSARAVKNAIQLSKRFIEENVLGKISLEMDKMQKVFKEPKYG
jgi:fatty acid/phospholipid biosynthesis enzyme